jgi:excisionase family DNA binding protein
VSEAAVPSDTSGYVGPSGAGRRLGLSSERVRQLIATGELPATKTVLGHLVRVDDVEALARARERARAAGAAGSAHAPH